MRKDIVGLIIRLGAVVGLLASLPIDGPRVGAGAAAPEKVPYETGMITWTWQEGPAPLNGEATELRVKCGPASGQYTLPMQTIPIPSPPAMPPSYSIPIREAVPRPGVWYCVATAAHLTNESKASVELPFDAESAGIAAPTQPRLSSE